MIDGRWCFHRETGLGADLWPGSLFRGREKGKGKDHREGVVRFLALQAGLPGTEPLITPALSGRPFKDLRRCKHSRGLTKASAPPSYSSTFDGGGPFVLFLSIAHSVSFRHKNRSSDSFVNSIRLRKKKNYYYFFF